MQRVIASNRFTMGEETEAFEEELAAFNQRKYAVCVNSGSSANLIATAALMLSMSDKLFSDIDQVRRAYVPALAWGTTYAPLIQHGMDLLLIDCDDTWNSLYGFDAPQPDLLVTCSILGNPSAVMASIENPPPWLNDDCEALGATVNGRPTASFGTVATQSFFWSHQLGAIEGGACLTDDLELANTMRCLRDHGLMRYDGSPKMFDHEYSFYLHGYNVRPVEMHMAIAREQLKKVPVARAHRLSNWRHFVRATEGLPIKLPPLAEGANCFGLHFELLDGSRRGALAHGLRASGIDCRLPTGGSYHLHPYGRSCADQPTPRADQIHRAGMFLGNAPFAIPEQIERAAQVIKETL